MRRRRREGDPWHAAYRMGRSKAWAYYCAGLAIGFCCGAASGFGFALWLGR
jgi:hypothetical protein